MWTLSRYYHFLIITQAQKLSPGEKAEADLGYRGEQAKIRLPVAGDDVKQHVRLRYETVNCHFKQFDCLGRVFRHKLEKHGAAPVITQLGIDDGNKLFYVSNYRS
jgi:hypothetical protein